MIRTGINLFWKCWGRRHRSAGQFELSGFQTYTEVRLYLELAIVILIGISLLTLLVMPTLLCCELLHLPIAISLILGPAVGIGLTLWIIGLFMGGSPNIQQPNLKKTS